jgi:type II restriction/modification system DNA methylase subunit YeeA
MPVNTAALKTFAPAMRRQLIEAVGRKLDLLLHQASADTLTTAAGPIEELRQQEATNRPELLERVAYSWFNRLAALRYLDARGWHPFGARVLMPQTETETQPEVLKLLRSGSLPAELQPHTDEARLQGLLDGRLPTAHAGADPQGEVYRELILAVCRSYHQLLPTLFEGLDDASELLLPDDLLSDGSIAGGFRSQISDGDCEDVEIIGWLYQFYISEKKDQVIGKVVKSEDIPAATQLFTPNWIVKYMVQNSLGAQWLATYPASALKGQMEYHIEPAEQTDEVKAQLAEITPEALNPEELTLIDPACGSGHILVEAYELFKAIYLERGYQQREIPQLILEKNLFGLDIDERAAQLTSFALMMKGRGDDRRLFERGIQLNVMALVNSDGLDVEGLANAINLADHGLKLADLVELKQLFEHATTFGSLIQVPDGLAQKLPALRRLSELKGQDMLVADALMTLEPLVHQAELLAARYDAVVANPPYMGSKGMNTIVKSFAQDYYPEAKSDLFACFIERGFGFLKDIGRNAMVTMESWMFLSSYESFRYAVLQKHTLQNLAHFPYDGKRPTVMGINFGVAVIEAQNTNIHDYKCTYCCSRHYELNDNGIPIEFPTLNERLVSASEVEFRKIPGSPIAYWASNKAFLCFEKPAVETYFLAKKGMAIGDNSRFLRAWHEVCIGSTKFDALDPIDTVKAKWYACLHGGAFRKWGSNKNYVVNWQNDGTEAKSANTKRTGAHWSRDIISTNFFFREGLNWSAITSGGFSCRYHSHGFAFTSATMATFARCDMQIEILLALVNSIVGEFFFKILSPTLNYGIADFKKLPYIIADSGRKLIASSKRLVSLSTEDWDAYERSWDFEFLPLLSASTNPNPNLESSYTAWIANNKQTIAEMKCLEEENNRLFIDAYGLQDELTPEVPIEQITLTVNPAYRYGGNLTEDDLWIRFRQDTIKELLSYATGCMMGRYSLDHPGLILANAGDTLENFNAKVGTRSDAVAFQPDRDGIIPVLDGEWFEDDIVARSREFLRVCFPASSLNTDLAFIETALGKDIRKYFCTDFYKDHLQTYKKRPIYWLVQSPSGPAKGGFACLIYLHRYTKDTLNLVLNNYFRPYLQKLEARQAQLGLDQLNDSLPSRERTAARKEAEKITKVLKECQAWEQDALLPLAQQRIELDLDDGVKVNYLKLQDVLAPIPGLAAKEE